jgi:repressor LexA
MKKLHPTQQKLLELLKNNMEEPLTIREIQELLHISSTSVVTHHLVQLEKKGYLKRNPADPRDYQILGTSPEKLITYLNLYGLAHCGRNGSILEGKPIDRIPISARILTFPSRDAFMVKAKGDSMEPRICEGDYIIARKTNVVDNGRIAVCVNNGEALIKKVQIEKDRVILISLNSKYAPFLAQDDFRVEGEVKSVITNKLE